MTKTSMSTASNTASAVQHPRPYLVFGLIACAFLMFSMNSNVLVVALPTMLGDLHTSLAWLGWTLTGFQLAQSISMPISGKISDDWGARRVLIASIAIFAIASLIAGFTPNVYVLILCRVLQALGGGAMLPSATSMISDIYGPRRAVAIGLFTSIFPLGGVIGPNLGGFVVDHLSWRWLFWANGPIGLAILLVAWRLLPRPQTRSGRRRIDVLGIFFFASAMILVLSAMTLWGNSPEAIHEPGTWLAVAVGISLLGVFLWHEARTQAPFMDLELLRSRPFLAANMYNFVYGASVFGFFSFIPFYATVAYGMSATQSGIVLTPRSIAMVLTSTFSSFVLIRFGYRLPLILGVLFVSPSLLLLSRGVHDLVLFGFAVPNIMLLSAFVLLSGIGMGVSGPASNNAALDLVPEKVAAVSGLRGMFRSTGGVLGTAAIVLMLSRFQDKGVGIQDTFFALGLLILLAAPIVFLIPDSARERYLARRTVEQDAANALIDGPSQAEAASEQRR